MANKEKKIKTRDSGFNIAYRVVTALAAAATFPVMFFTSLFYFAYTIPYFSLISGDASDTGASYLTMSIYEVLSDSSSFKELFMGKDSKVDLAGVIAEVKPQLIAIACLYAAVALLALLIIVFACFTRKKLPIVITSLLGVGVLSFIPLAFSKLTAPFTDGTINLDSFLHTGLESIMDLVAKVDFIRAGDAYTYLWVIFAGIVVWTGAVMLVNMGDEPKKNKQPKEKKAE
ncbi:MAG: hypothetical protein E7515_04920 [Ruminococcaceae bacterium]|jgi:uncharacterized membrane protein (UPF0136 family)|nr:hypothetical protein [Oscillospiraceae bacterium]